MFCLLQIQHFNLRLRPMEHLCRSERVCLFYERFLNPLLKMCTKSCRSRFVCEIEVSVGLSGIQETTELN